MKLFFKPINVSLSIHGLLFRDIHFPLSGTLKAMANDPIKLNYAIKACLKDVNISLFKKFKHFLILFFFIKYFLISTISVTSIIL